MVTVVVLVDVMVLCLPCWDHAAHSVKHLHGPCLVCFVCWVFWFSVLHRGMSRVFRNAATSIPFRSHVNRFLQSAVLAPRDGTTPESRKALLGAMSPLWTAPENVALLESVAQAEAAAAAAKPAIFASTAAAPTAAAPTPAPEAVVVKAGPLFTHEITMPPLQPFASTTGQPRMPQVLPTAVRTLKNCPISLPPHTKLLPRCGATGQFFSDEHVVDALFHSAVRHSFGSPFWIRSNHPDLLSGYLTLKGGAVPTVVSSYAVCYPASRIRSTLPPRSRLPPGSHGTVTTTGPHCNAISGFPCTNPIFQTAPWAESSDGWVTLDQCFKFKLQLKPLAKPLPAEVDPWQVGGGVFVEMEELELYNGSQLEIPGRLALKRSVADIAAAATDASFDPFAGPQ